eukprot:6347023-Amphidinium_carterae.2
MQGLSPWDSLNCSESGMHGLFTWVSLSCSECCMYDFPNCVRLRCSACCLLGLPHGVNLRSSACCEATLLELRITGCVESNSEKFAGTMSALLRYLLPELADLAASSCSPSWPCPRHLCHNHYRHPVSDTDPRHRPLRLMTWNIGSWWTQSPLLLPRLDHCDVILIQETHVDALRHRAAH